MNATIDSYLQVVVSLSEEDLGILEKRRQLEGKIWRSYDNRELKLTLYVKDAGWRTEFLPRKDIYEIDFPPKGLNEIRQRKLAQNSQL
jgi:hypothetical protein